MSYYIPEEALKDLESEQKRLLNLVGLNVLTAEQAKKTYWDKLRKVISQSYRHTEGQTRPVAIQCYGCGRVSVVQSDVMRFKCVCSPNDERFTFQCRKIDLTLVGDTPLEQRIFDITGVRPTSE